MAKNLRLKKSVFHWDFCSSGVIYKRVLFNFLWENRSLLLVENLSYTWLEPPVMFDARSFETQIENAHNTNFFYFSKNTIRSNGKKILVEKRGFHWDFWSSKVLYKQALCKILWKIRSLLLVENLSYTCLELYAKFDTCSSEIQIENAHNINYFHLLQIWSLWAI